MLGLVSRLLAIKISCLPRKLLENEELRFEEVESEDKGPMFALLYEKHGLCFAPFQITLKNTITKLNTKPKTPMALEIFLVLFLCFLIIMTFLACNVGNQNL